MRRSPSAMPRMGLRSAPSRHGTCTSSTRPGSRFGTDQTRLHSRPTKSRASERASPFERYRQRPIRCRPSSGACSSKRSRSRPFPEAGTLAGRVNQLTSQESFAMLTKLPQPTRTLVALLVIAASSGACQPGLAASSPLTTTPVPQTTPFPSGSPAESATPRAPAASASPAAPPLRFGTYQEEISVQKILENLEEDSTLTSTEKTAVIDRILGIRGAEILTIRFTFTAASFTFRQGVAHGPLHDSIPEPWRVTAFDD